jgi:hypothetical protein
VILLYWFLSSVSLFTNAAVMRADGYDAPLVDCFCWLTPGLLRLSAPFSLAVRGPRKEIT